MRIILQKEDRLLGTHFYEKKSVSDIHWEALQIAQAWGKA